MLKEIAGRINVAWRSVPLALRATLFVVYEFVCCAWLVVSGAVLYLDFVKKSANFWALLSVTAILCVAIAGVNLAWFYTRNLQAKYIEDLEKKKWTKEAAEFFLSL
jgi:D-alanyl-lipoteichoic acid acyltransferase DltB (MBOAT superfamily)